MKKLVCCLLALSLLAACGRGEDPAETALPTEEIVETASPTEAPTPPVTTSPAPEPQETEDSRTTPETPSGETMTLGYVQAYGGSVYATGEFTRVEGWSELPVDAYFFGIYADSLYYVSQADMGDPGAEVPLYRAELDGSGISQLTDNVFLGVLPRIVNGYLVYTSNGMQGEDQDSAGLYRLNLADGTRELCHQGMYYTILGLDDTHVYYRAYEERDGAMALALYRMDPVTGEREHLDLEIANNSVADGYFYSPGLDEILRIDPDGVEPSLSIPVTFDELGGFTVHEGWIYYSDGESVCRVSTDGEQSMALCPIGDGVYWASGFFVVEDFVYFYQTVDTDETGMNAILTRVPAAGGEREPLFTLYVN